MVTKGLWQVSPQSGKSTQFLLHQGFLANPLLLCSGSIVSAAPDEIVGLVALRRRENHVEVILLESHPRHVGRTKRFWGIAGSLFAFAAQLSFDLGGEGFVAIDAKSGLIEHYQRTYGFKRVGSSQRMILSTEAAARLISQYGGRPTHG